MPINVEEQSRLLFSLPLQIISYYMKITLDFDIFQLINFGPLLEMMEETHPEVKISVRKLAAVSLLEVFKDVLPSYFIKHHDMENVRCKSSTVNIFERLKYSFLLLYNLNFSPIY